MLPRLGEANWESQEEGSPTRRDHPALCFGEKVPSLPYALSLATDSQETVDLGLPVLRGLYNHHPGGKSHSRCQEGTVPLSQGH